MIWPLSEGAAQHVGKILLFSKCCIIIIYNYIYFWLHTWIYFRKLFDLNKSLKTSCRHVWLNGCVPIHTHITLHQLHIHTYVCMHMHVGHQCGQINIFSVVCLCAVPIGHIHTHVHTYIYAHIHDHWVAISAKLISILWSAFVPSSLSCLDVCMCVCIYIYIISPAVVLG